MSFIFVHIKQIELLKIHDKKIIWSNNKALTGFNKIQFSQMTESKKEGYRL
ncbi:hypothetical protein M2451_002261 [Dysgonomonas sp. PFB1-18]|nr:hypothetical protein [Dysgonomonas sp. PF1-14]MDH6339434.1 hypothetical protein [Dysgonomonas sp. PF1-16]MDH6380933.1 hypothetical protein [Dysgonomonas sp. PFB1-18]MDH6397942.1 hypothetical protein [Dysgonomonas sp. PF1-23]